MMNEVHRKLMEKSKGYRKWHEDKGYHTRHWIIFIAVALTSLIVLTNEINKGIVVVDLSTIRAATTDVIPSDRQIDWSQAGIPGGIPNHTTICSTINASIYGDGVTDATTAIQTAVNNCPLGQVVYLPQGTYRIGSTISLVNKSVVLRGDGPSKTKLEYSGSSDIIKMGNQYTNEGTETAILSGYTKGSTSLTVQSATAINVGDYLVISQLNKSGLVYRVGINGDCTWCGDNNPDRTMGQIVQVTAKNSNTLSLNKPLYFTFESSLLPQAKPMKLTANVGLEDLYIHPTAQTTSGSKNILIFQCAYCWVKNVESNMAGSDAHVFIRKSYGDIIRDSYFNDGYTHGSGKSYGIFLFGRNSDHLIENNILRKARHSLILEGGGSGNVFGYNYAIDGYSEPDTNWLSGDADTHGSHPYMNLWEGNIYTKLAHDNTWGSSSHNTNFRNYMTTVSSGVTLARAAADIQIHNYYENLVGNILGTYPSCSGVYENTPPQAVDNSSGVMHRLAYSSPGGAIPSPLDSQVAATMLRHGNYDCVTQSTKWDSSLSQQLPASLYLSSKPSWFGNVSWPAIGPDVAGFVNKIPAQLRYEGVNVIISPPPPPPTPDTTAPSVSISAPVSGSTVSGTVAVTATASDNVGVVGVQFKLDGANLSAEDTSSPYSINWDTTSATNGTHTLTAIARDAAGNQTTSAVVTVTVSNTITPPSPVPTTDTTPPIVSITAPLNNTLLTKDTTISIGAAASDTGGVTKVDFLINGTLKCTDLTSPYSCSWNVPHKSGRTYRLQAQATDTSGNIGTSSIVTVTVQ